jgi:hypothetical protein
MVLVIRTAAVIAASFLLFLFPKISFADESAPGPPPAAPLIPVGATRDGPPTPATRALTPEEIRQSMREQLGLVPKKRIPHGPNSVKLFDTENAIGGLELRAGLLSFRRGDESERGFQGGGYDFQILKTTSSQSGMFFLNGVQGTHLRVLDSKSFLWSILTQELASGATLGPFELEVRFGFAAFNLDRLRGDGWNFSMLSPKVGLNAGLRLWKVRADFGIHSEYYWRWFGPSVLTHTASLGIRFESRFSQDDLLKPEEKPVLESAKP